MIVEQNHRVIDRLGHEALGLQLSVERKLAAIGDPQISWREETAETGFFRALIGKRRDVLVIAHARLREYLVLIVCRAHGTVLHVGWMVVVTPRLANDLRRAVRLDVEPGTRFEVGGDLDLFDVMDLKAFIGTTRLALNHAIREVAERDGVAEGDPWDEPNGVE